MNDMPKLYDGRRYIGPVHVGKRCDACKWSKRDVDPDVEGYRLNCHHSQVGKPQPVIVIRGQAGACGEPARLWGAK